MTFQGLDHLALVVPDTEESLLVWRDKLGFPVLYSEVVNGGAVRLTHLDLGNTHLQLVEPLTPDHPLQLWLREHGSGLHHFCLKVGHIDSSIEEARREGIPVTATPHQGTQGKRALFLPKEISQGVQVELTGT